MLKIAVAKASSLNRFRLAAARRAARFCEPRLNGEGVVFPLFLLHKGERGHTQLDTPSPGGRTIINTVSGIVLNVLEFEMSVRDAVDAPRLHHQWLPDVIRVEAILAKEHAKTLEKLREMGHTIERTSATQGDAHSIRVHPRTGRYEGAADRRRSGWAAGY